MATTNLGADLLNHAEDVQRAGWMIMKGEYLAGNVEITDLVDATGMSRRSLRRRFAEVDGSQRTRGDGSIIVRRRKGL
jgi:AraC-like DNA-binding protein